MGTTPDPASLGAFLTSADRAITAHASDATLSEVAAHLPDTVTRIHPTSDGFAIRITHRVTLDDIDGIIAAAECIPAILRNNAVTTRDIASAIASILDADITCSADATRNLRDYLAAVDTIDPETADAILQVACFGEIVYG